YKINNKGFETEDEAQDYLNDKSNVKTVSLNEKVDSNVLEVYVDGSYNAVYKLGGYGCVMLQDGEVIHTISTAFDIDENRNTWNVEGETFATLTAVEWAMKKGFTNMFLYYDYTGIKHWADGSWTANKVTTREYQRKMKQYQQTIHINFIKVKAHSGNKYNDLADKLAKKAIDDAVN